MIVLKILGWTLLSLLILIILVLFIKVRIIAEYSSDNTSVMLQWLFLKIPLYPSKKKKAKDDVKDASPEATPEEAPPDESSQPSQEDEKQPDEAVAEETPPEKTEKKAKPEKPKESLLHIIYRTNGIDGIILILRRVFSYLSTFFGNLLNSVVIEQLYVDIRCARGDAAATAIYYGEVCSSVFPMLGALVSKCKVRKYDINVYPDYMARFSDASFRVQLYVIPQFLIGITLALVFKLLFKVVLRLFMKIFMHSKNKDAENDINKSKEKSEVTNE